MAWAIFGGLNVVQVMNSLSSPSLCIYIVLTMSRSDSWPPTSLSGLIRYYIIEGLGGPSNFLQDMHNIITVDMGCLQISITSRRGIFFNNRLEEVDSTPENLINAEEGPNLKWCNAPHGITMYNGRWKNHKCCFSPDALEYLATCTICIIKGSVE